MLRFGIREYLLLRHEVLRNTKLLQKIKVCSNNFLKAVYLIIMPSFAKKCASFYLFQSLPYKILYSFSLKLLDKCSNVIRTHNEGGTKNIFFFFIYPSYPKKNYGFLIGPQVHLQWHKMFLLCSFSKKKSPASCCFSCSSKNPFSKWKSLSSLLQILRDENLFSPL